MSGEGLGAATDCPNCGRPLAVSNSLIPSSDGGIALIRRYFSDVWEITTRPTQYFRRMPVTGGLSGPLAFALVTHWLSAAFEYLWHLLVSGMVGSQMDPVWKWVSDGYDVDSPGRGAMLMEMKDRLIHWTYGAGSVIVDPFLTLLSILFTAFFVFIGAKLLVTPLKNGAPRVITFESALRIVSYGLTPSILAFIPILGTFVAWLLVPIVTIIAAKEVYRIGSGRATVVALFPKLLFLGILLLGFSLFAIALVKMMASMF